DLPQVRRFWAMRSGAGPDAGARAEASGDALECLVCGEIRPAVKRLPLKVKGIPNGQTSGLALISANERAFESYGLEASLIAPTCQECSEAFSKGLNDLLARRSTSLRVVSIAYVFWTRDGEELAFASLLSQPQPEDVRALLESARTGARGAVGLDASPFYAAALSASGARVTVRDWLDTTVGAARESLGRYFGLQRIVGPYGEEGAPLGVWTLAAATVRDPAKDLAPATVPALLRLALGGGVLPVGLLHQAVRRNYAE